MSLIKIAKDFQTMHYHATKAYDNMMEPHRAATTGPYGKGFVIGGLSGAALGMFTKDPMVAVGAGGVGALLGLAIASSIHDNNAHARAKRHNKNYRQIVNKAESLEEFVTNQSYNDERQREYARNPARLSYMAYRD